MARLHSPTVAGEAARQQHVPWGSPHHPVGPTRTWVTQPMARVTRGHVCQEGTGASVLQTDALQRLAPADPARTVSGGAGRHSRCPHRRPIGTHPYPSGPAPRWYERLIPIRYGLVTAPRPPRGYHSSPRRAVTIRLFRGGPASG